MLLNRHTVGHPFYAQSLSELPPMKFVVLNHRPMVFWTPNSVESLVDSHRGDALMNRHRVGHHFYARSINELPLME